MNRKRLHGVVSSSAGLFIVLAILVVLHVVLRQVSIRKDLTRDRLFTLSDGTTGLLQSLDRDVTLKLYVSKSAESMPIPLKQYAQRIEDLLGEYEAHSGGKLIVEIYDPRPDSDDEEWAQRYGLVGQGMNVMGGPQIYMGLVAVSGPHEAAIPFLSPAAEPQIEYLLTRLIHDVIETKKPKVGVLSSMPVMGDPFAAMVRRQSAPGWMVIEELRKQVEVVPVATDASLIAAEIDTLVVIHPKELGPDTLFAIDQFVMRGGRLLAFVDPLCLAEEPYAGELPFPAFVRYNSDLNRLTAGWGAELVKGEVVVDQDNATRISRGVGAVERAPSWLSLRPESMDRHEIATASLKLVMMPFAGGFQLTNVNGVVATPLLWTSKGSGFVGTFASMGQSSGVMQSFREDGSRPLAVRLQGRFKTAFPDGKPKRPESKEGEAAADDGILLRESEQPGVVVLVADVDMLADQNCVRPMDVFGQAFYQPMNDNITFVLNTVEQLGGSEALIGLRSRGTFIRPFTRVLAMEKQAQEKWQKEELRLQSKLQESQMRLNELQSAKQQDQAFILSPEQKSELEKFRVEQFQTQQELKKVRKNLRREIEMLGIQLKAANVALVPALMALFGLVYGWRRRRRGAGK